MKLLSKEKCPGCKNEFESEHELESFEPIRNKGKIENIIDNSKIEKKEPEIIEKEVTKTVIEDFKPNYECPNGNCDVGVHKNKNFKKRPKGKCTNCEQFSKHDSGTCPWCKKDEIEPIDSEELDELGIAKPPEQEYEGHDHE